VIFLLLLLAGSAAAAQTVVVVSPHRLRTMTPSELRALLFDPNAPEFVESWVQGPTHRLEYIDVELASRSRPTVYSGLCSVEMGYTSSRWMVGKQTEDSPLEMRKGRTQRYFMLASDRPTLDRGAGQAEDCSGISAFARIRGTGPQPVPVWFSPQSPTTSADADAARFGFAAVIAAQQAAKRLPVPTERCWAGSTDIPLACNAPADFVQSRYLRDIRALVIERCTASDTLCVDATIARSNNCGTPWWWANGCGEDHLVIETEARSLAEALGAIGVKSLLIRAGATPIT
jgi:hypothetical protein